MMAVDQAFSPRRVRTEWERQMKWWPGQERAGLVREYGRESRGVWQKAERTVAGLLSPNL